MCGISTNFVEAVKRVSDVLRVTGKVLPVTLDNVVLKADFPTEQALRGEKHHTEIRP